MNKQQAWNVPKIIYSVLMSFLLLGYMIIIATYRDSTVTGQSYNLPIQFWILRLVTAIMAIYFGKLWKDKAFLILMVYLLLKVIRVAIDNPSYVFEQSVSESLLTGFWVFSACYGLARIFEKDQLKKFLAINASVWTVGMVVYSCIGIYAAWTGEYVFNISRGSYWGLVIGRLFLCYYETTSASVLSISAVITLAGAFITKRKAAKVLFVVSMLPMILALCLTDTRSAQITVAAGTATMVGIATLRKLKYKKIETKKIHPRYAWPVAAAATAVIFAMVILLCSNTVQAFNQVRKTGLFVNRALAESAEIADVANRGFSGNDILNGRPLIWKATMQVLGSSKKIILAGTSIRNPMTQVNALGLIGDIVSHTHNMPLMILLENGIIGFILMGAFFIILAVRSFRIITDKENNRERFILPVIISVAVGELVECFTWLRGGQAPVLPFFFVAIGLIMAAGNKSNI